MGRSILTSGVVLALAAQFASAVLPRGVHKARVLKEPADLADSYDYVIVGGGTAGLTIADRLTEDEDTTVLVIEYGLLSDSESIKTVRGGFGGFGAPGALFPTRSVPQVNLGNRVIDVLAGKVVGGSSAVNAMMTIRGAKGDYDRWGQFFREDSEWSWEGILPYFKKALTFVPPNEDVAESSGIVYDTSFWGEGESGVYTSWPSFQYPGTSAQLEAWKEVPGVTFPPDSGSGETGVYWYPQFMDPKLVERSYARTGHYSNSDRENYHLVTNSKVIKIVVEDGTATGVSFRPADDPAGEVSTIKASKEVIVSAGAVHTPQVLQLSGIGPSALLEAAGIETIVDLPGVGQNFQDHPMLTARFTLRSLDVSPKESDLSRGGEFRTWADEVWAANRTGPYSIATGNLAAWLSYPVISARYDEIATRLEEQDHAAYLPEGTDSTVAAGYKAQMLSYAEALRANHTGFYNHAITASPSNGIIVDLHPLSRGTININPENPDAEPLVDYRALSNPLDAAIMADIIRFARSFYMDNAFNAQYDPVESQPGASVQTDEEMATYLARTLSPTEYHPAGTAAMLPKELGGVVDEDLRVYGVAGLRVADASIMPTLVGANTCQTVYAIAEKAADLIKGSVTTTNTNR
ncbi:related to alcohol oxidase [Cephalotrichum gorgonifer]|uniref:Related to alcohol oxidase n=1 Tax=Cephalotrichum gorgonifer TaxID=2041049 RepID=A0AAE8MST8_9PEZI|nr:related to alcohol oxidase [Cephalotrichum gorgonifer]